MKYTFVNSCNVNMDFWDEEEEEEGEKEEEEEDERWSSFVLSG